MTTTQNELWQKVKAFKIDDTKAIQPFSHRLREEQNWAWGFTERAIEEYKKFMFLAVVCDFSVTPCKVVDEVWHAHLTFTRSYWEDFCEQTLGKPIHHTPSGGSEEEDEKYHESFHKTKEAYESFFGEKAPTEIWDIDPEMDRIQKANEDKRHIGYAFSFIASLFGGLTMGSLFGMGFIFVLGLILSSAVFPNPYTNTNESDGGSSGSGCGSSSCGSSCGGGCGGCGGG